MEKQKARCVAVFGTGSDVGKSIVTTAICRILADRGIRVAPFKAQNMSNNSGVTPEGLEMGRAQIVQAEAARAIPHVDMNPILLKPTGETGSQLVLLGEAVENNTAVEYHRKKDKLVSVTNAAFDRLSSRFDVIVLEGAGSCAEVNLMPEDIVNLHMAAYAGAPVILVGDIHRGGIFAQMVGTLECLSTAEREQIAGFIVNRFRGDIRLFQEGIRWIEQRTGKPVYGVLPWYSHITIEAEDSVVIENPIRAYPGKSEGNGRPSVAVIRIPHISNFTDIDPLNAIEGLNVYFVEKVQPLKDFAAVIIPGSKNTCADIVWLRKTGWEKELSDYVGNGGNILGICGGYQMLGEAVHDPDGLEGDPGTTPGLGLLPVETTLKAPKTTTLTRFEWGEGRGAGYEIHMGQTRRLGGEAVFRITERNGKSADDEDGCMSAGGRVMGSYIHGMFDATDITSRWLAKLGLDHLHVPEMQGPDTRDREYDRLAAHFEAHIDTDGILALLGLEKE